MTRPAAAAHTARTNAEEDVAEFQLPNITSSVIISKVYLRDTNAGDALVSVRLTAHLMIMFAFS